MLNVELLLSTERVQELAGASAGLSRSKLFG